MSLASELADVTDPRVITIAKYVLKSMSQKSDKWNKMYSVETNKELISVFLDQGDVSALLAFVLPSSGGALQVEDAWPHGPQGKFCYFIKKTNKPVGKDGLMVNSYYYGDLPGAPLDYFSAFVDTVIVPILTNMKNHEEWPSIVSKDILQEVQKLKKNVDVVVGQVKGKTVLSFPFGLEDFKVEYIYAKNNSEFRALIHTFESSVIEWSHLIHDVLKRNSTAFFQGGRYPGPFMELDFWKDRVNDLEYIYNQLKTPNAKKMSCLLEKTNSVYFYSFQNLFHDIVAALEEAKDIHMYLKILRPFYEEMEMADFTNLERFFRAIYHLICLVWANSKYYNTPVHIITLLKGTCNMVIELTRTYLEPTDIFKGETEEKILKVEDAENILKCFKDLFFEYQNIISDYFPENVQPELWTFNPDLVFDIFDKFSMRVQTIKAIMDTYTEFIKLEKVALGGIEGQILDKQVEQLCEEFKDQYRVFQDKSYDTTDFNDPEFLQDYHVFRDNISDMDNRLATITCQAFDDCAGLSSCFTMIKILGSLLERPIIKKSFDKKYNDMIRQMQEEMETVRNIYDVQMSHLKKYGRIQMHKFLPVVSGSLKWAEEMRMRISGFISQFKRLEHNCCENDEAVELYRQYQEMMNLLTEFEVNQYAEWTKSLVSVCETNLSHPLIARNKETKLISVNFDLALSAVLSEVKYMKIRGIDNIPECAMDLFLRGDDLYTYKINLDLIVNWYNDIRTSAIKEEQPLIEIQLEKIDEVLQKAIEEMDWNDKGMTEYIDEAKKMVYALTSNLQNSQANVKKIEQLMVVHNKVIFERKEEKFGFVLNLDDKKERLKKYTSGLKDTGKTIHGLVKENLEYFKANPNDDSWKKYLDYLDQKVIDGFYNLLHTNLKFFLENTDSNNPIEPFFQTKLSLEAPEMVFTPSLSPTYLKGLYDIVDELVESIFAQTTFILRLAEHTELEDYLQDLSSNAELMQMRNQLMENLENVMTKACEYRDTFDHFSYLWKEDRTTFMKNFLLYGKLPTEEELQSGSIEECPPTLEQFKQQIDKYESIYTEAEGIQKTIIFDKWFRVDVQLFKQSLLNTIKKWSLMFKQHLVNHVTSSVTELHEFIQVTNGGLGTEVNEGDYDALVGVMGLLRDINKRMEATDNMFEPLRNTIQLIKSYDQPVPPEIEAVLEELPQKWSDLKKMEMATKQQVAPLQVNEFIRIRKKLANFDATVGSFRKSFLKMQSFNYECTHPYDFLDKNHQHIIQLQTDKQLLVDSAVLFGVGIPEFKPLRVCEKELKLLKQLWDYVNIICSSIDDWKTTLWAGINVEQMDMDCKKFAKDIRQLDKDMRAWDAFVQTELTVKNMITSLSAVGDLQNPAIRDRHWQQLMQATNVWFTMDEKTTLADLLSLNLHKFEDEVKNIVDKAVKEASMEKVLTTITKIWATMEFDHEKHPRTKITMLQTSEKLIETLEENQVQLQNMLASKFIDFFLAEVSDWQRKLTIADQVITIWMKVQRTWSHLESIFTESDDIKEQLPEDSARFLKTDLEFKAIVCEVEVTTNVVEATGKPNLFERLETIMEELTKCEKALAEYLETKRLAFPRFYFVSSADLLDILSNGNNPIAVSVHLTKLFDCLAGLKFRSEDMSQDKTATHMISKDGECVDLDKTCDCSGQVEIWLNRVLDVMKTTICYHMREAVLSYEEKPRDQWLFDYPAQVALVGMQVWWAAEVNMSFARMEEGYENAMKEYQKKQVNQLNNLITMLMKELSRGDRQKIMTICTIEVHSRDVVTKLVTAKIANSQAFLWLSQLQHRWDDKERDCFANICDAQFRYSHEYLGNTPRLVITPLTDRCYITLTQSLHLIMSGAPAGPAGTGKTETTKDLGRALGVMVYVFNCSEQMDYKSVGNIYKGLAQSGAWGCFDEFNRISVEVLSVIAVQVKSIQDAIKEKKKEFNFMGETIKLFTTVGIFITMNPGYAGRTELPENLKALFRPCAMVVPDFELICEIMLIAEAFLDARLLARKFITLYSLCKELLSKQDHYDWGLRAIKSVLVVAGSLRRGDPNRPEDQVLMRALRDFNVPKIVTDDTPVFMGLISDLFPSLDVPRKRDLDFEKNIREAVIDLKLQPEDSFILKIVQLQELFDVRHSVFIIGCAGTGKSKVWKSLLQTHRNQKLKPLAVDLDPKAVTNDELFGIINPATREWKDGLFSVIMRDLANLTGDGPKWIVLDGDIDPMWIESLNTVMDDNKVLTLASNERIPLTNTMRLLFEISHLKTATPATVSRAGILYINPQDLGWNPCVQSWVDNRELQSEKGNLLILFDKYVPALLETLRDRFKKITPISECNQIQMLCYLLECLLTPENIPADSPKELYELYFVFAAVWAFGGALFQDQMVDHRKEFSNWWVKEFKAIKFPTQGTVFDYYIDTETKKFEHWSRRVAAFQLDPDVPLQSTMVPTAETTQIRYFLDMLIASKRPVMLVGTAGCGKTVLLQDKLLSMSDDYVTSNVPFNFYTTSEMLQTALEKPLEKKAGRNYGPVGSKKLIYFVDDINMPEVDQYFTVQPHTILRQHLDHNHWYDRAKLTLKEIHNTQYVSCMNPTAGSFTIDSRLQRHFCVFAVSFPSQDSLNTIYNSILSQHLQQKGFPAALQKFSANIAAASLTLHGKVCQMFLPTAIKFHYIFNLRELSNIFQGILFSSPSCCQTVNDLITLWMHETQRVYSDKLADLKDVAAFKKLQKDLLTKVFDDLDEAAVQKNPLIYNHFATGIGEPKYMPVSNWPSLTKILTEALENYNDMYAAMNLVLFEDAITHICRINRILETPMGNALLIGVGGSGKQSLSRLAAFISSMEVSQITLRKGYAIADLKADLNILYQKTGIKGIAMVFLMTDAQVADEKFLVVINDLLVSGEIPGLFSDDEIANIINACRGELKSLGIDNTNENCWRFFIDKVRRTLKVVLCFSPVGATLRVRARKFPALINCTCIDWFHEWPEEALVAVSSRLLQENELLTPQMKISIPKFLAYVHNSVNEMSIAYLTNEKRYNYTTPKSFLEQIVLYQNLLRLGNENLLAQIVRLENGLEKLKNTSDQVDDLKAKLAVQEVELAEKNEAANKLIKVVGTEAEKVSKEKAIADEEEKKVQVINEEVSKKAKDCGEDLAKAEPALLAARDALDTLNKNNLTEMKSFGSPPAAVSNVASAVMVLLAPKGNVPKDRSWKAAKASIMSKADSFLAALKDYDKENIHENCQKAIQPYLKDPEFNPGFIQAKSTAAAGLCSWVINIVKFYEVFKDVEPKRMALEEANAELAAAQEKLAGIMAKIDELDKSLAKLTAKFQEATDAKLKCQAEADATNKTIELANRLVNGLASENVRWAESIDELHKKQSMLPGDTLLVSSFVSYLGCFTKSYRVDLIVKNWTQFLRKKSDEIPTSEGLDPLTLLTDDAAVAGWNNEGLPNDPMSIENATILTNCERWPLMIDPQLQGIKWIKNRYSSNLKIVRLGQKGYLDVIERAVSDGDTILIENLEESIDPVLDPVLGRNTIKKGKAIKIGDKEIEYNPKFFLILHTKLANPHYKPEMQAQTTLINFTVTRDGLEEQLLAAVVCKERPDLEKLKSELTRQQNEFKITLKELEDSLLARLSAAGGNFLGDYALVENLETTKATAAEIEKKVIEAKKTEISINEAREYYRPTARRASLLYFLLNDLHKINPMYQFSLKAFHVVFDKAIEKAEPDEDVSKRVVNLTESITHSTFIYTTRGLFERDKLIFLSQMTFQICLLKQEINPIELDFLLRFPFIPNLTSPVDFINNMGWGGIKLLSEKEEFQNLDKDIEGSMKRWKKYVESECPEKEQLPQEWKNKTPLQKLCLMRVLRPDRMTYALRQFAEEKMGENYTSGSSVPFASSYEESSPATPIFFILSPGVDPLKDVEALGKKMGFSGDHQNFWNISLGQGQEIVAEKAMDLAAEEGHWVILQNVHLVAKWLPVLEKKLEEFSHGSHEEYRIYVSAEPASTPASHIIPQGILESAIKITNEPPTGMQANLHKALNNFDQEKLEMCSRELEFKSILFALCYFHAVVQERRKFGPQGWNRTYPFNVGDLTISVNVLYNYLEANNKVPWEDLRYLFGEIMYGGHITDDWDRRLCRTYLEVYMHSDMIDAELELAPGFPIPPNSDYKAYHVYIDDVLPPESPYLYGLHPNAEIEFLTNTSEHLFKTVFEMQPRDTGAGAGAGISREEKVKSILDEIVQRLPEEFLMAELMGKVPPEARTPYVIVAFQECERMNMLTGEIRLSLKDLDLGMKGELTITVEMEALSNSLFMDKVPDTWAKRAYPSLASLTSWYADYLLRVKELETWVSDFQLPAAVWLSGFFNPQSFLTAIMQQMARKNEWPLDKMAIQCEVTKKSYTEMSGPPREGAYIHGLYMEGARWDTQSGMIAESHLKDLTPLVPVIFLKAIPVDRTETKNIYQCPVYKTKMRGPTFVWTFNMKSKEKASKWVLGGVALLLQV